MGARGRQYYPKLQVAVPFTPVPGARLLGTRPQQLLAALEAVTVQNGLSSAHISFIDDAGAAECERRGWLIRHGLQYHWFNRGYASFDDFLGALSSRKRKAIRKERAAAREGSSSGPARAPRSAAAEWDAMWAFYQDTGARKWGHPYLTREFFDLIGETMGDRLLLFLACRDGLPIAGALNFIGTTRCTAAIGAASTKCRSCISSSAIITRSNGRSPTASPASRRARRASINCRAAMSRW